MSWWHLVAFGGWFNLIGAWASILYQQRHFKAGRLLIEECPPSPTSSHAASQPRVCVVIPAHNEEASLPDCVASVQAQRGCNLEMRIVDDRSTDRTNEIAQQLGKQNARLSVHRIEALAAGWMGKSHALWQGSRDLNADWLLFLDADCRLLSPYAVRTVVDEAQQRDVGLLSLWPSQAAGGFWEHMLIPLCAAMIAMWFGSPAVNSNRSSRAFANGQFLLVRRQSYENIGGHAAVHRALIEDVPLAEHAKRCGVSCLAAGGPSLVSVRMYKTFGETWRGWSRIFVGALRSWIKLVLTFLWLIIGSLLPFVLLPFAIVSLTFVSPENASQTIPAIVTSSMGTIHILLIMLVSWRFWGVGRCDRRYLVLYPVSVVVVAGIVLQSLWWLVWRRQVGWKSNTYGIDRRGQLLSTASDRVTSAS